MTFHSPAFLWLLAALPVVVLLHYLRARRVRHEVSALFLWERATQSAARRRRVRPSWLLLAQLLFTALAAFALARPALTDRSAPDLVIIVDASASMAAAASAAEVGAEEPLRRIDVALETAAGLTSGAGRLAIVRAGTEATLLLALEASAAQRVEAISDIEVGDAAADLGGALDLAASLLPGAEVHVLTDQQLDIGQATVHVVGESVPNAGIGAFEIGIGQVFVGVVASGPQPVQRRVVISRDGEEMASSDALVPAGGVGTLTFPLQDLSGVIEARIVAPPDALPADDVAYAGSRPVDVVTDDTHGAVTRAISAVPNTEVSYSRGAAILAADLRVLTGGGAPQVDGPYVSFPPPALEPTYAVIRDFDRAYPLLRFADLSEVVVGLDPSREPWPAEAEGWRVLARTSDLEPVIRVREGDDLALEFAFHPSQSDLTLRPAFPAIFANVLSELRSTSRVRLGEASEAGEPVLEPGVHEDEGGTVVLASLLSASESRLPRQGELSTPAAAGQETPRDGGADGPATDDAADGPAADGPATDGGEADGAAAGGASGPAGGGEPTSSQVAEQAPRPVGPIEPPGNEPTTAALVLCGLALMALVAEWVLRRTRFAAR